MTTEQAHELKCALQSVRNNSLFAPVARLVDELRAENAAMKAALDTDSDQERLCRWPDGTEKRVIVTAIKAHVIWNERHEEIGKLGCVTGLEDDVPLSWLNT